MQQIDIGEPPMSWNDRVRQSNSTLTLPFPSGD